VPLPPDVLAKRKKEALAHKGRNPLVIDPDISTHCSIFTCDRCRYSGFDLAQITDISQEESYFEGMKSGTTMYFHSPYQRKMEVRMKLLDDLKTITFGDHGWSTSYFLSFLPAIYQR